MILCLYRNYSITCTLSIRVTLCVNSFISKITNVKPAALKVGLEFLSQRLGESIIVLASDKTVTVKVSDSFVKNGVNAGKIVGEIARATGANGGGRPNFAQGGIKDASKLDDILPKIEAELK